jgi:hypothetical protein
LCRGVVLPGWFVDPGDGGQLGWGGWFADETLGVRGVGRVEDLASPVPDELGAAVVDVGGGVKPDAGVAVVVVVPAEELLAVGVGVLEAAEAGGEVGPILEGPELALRIRVVVADVRPRVRLGDAEVGEQVSNGLAIIGPPRSAWMVRWSRVMFCLSTASASSAWARRAFSVRASIHPGTYRLQMSMITYR